MSHSQDHGALLDEIQSLRQAVDMLLPAAKIARAAIDPFGSASVERDQVSDAIGGAKYWIERAEALRVRRLKDA